MSSKSPLESVCVEDNTIEISSDLTTRLYTEGVSTCFGIIIKGRIYDHQFVLLHHWSGFKPLDISFWKCSPVKEISNLASQYRTEIEKHFKLSLDELEFSASEDDEEEIPILLHEIYIIGGQKRDNYIFGTESEAKALEDHLEQELRDQDFNLDSCDFNCSFFTTAGLQSLTLYCGLGQDLKIKLDHGVTNTLSNS